MIFYPTSNLHVMRPNYVVRSAPIEFEYDIEGREDYFLQCDTIAGITVEARAEGDISWTNLETTPIDTEPYIGFKQRFEFKITPDAYTEDHRKLVRIFCSKL